MPRHPHPAASDPFPAGGPDDPAGSPATRSQAKLLASLLNRRSVSPRRLGPPGPSTDELQRMVEAALRAPDHGGLHPWRIVEFAAHNRGALADYFEQEKLRRDPLATSDDLLRAREHATRSPVLLGFVVAVQQRSKVPAREQWLAAGAALGNLLQAAHQLGYGAITLSGERCFDGALLTQLGIAEPELLAGFVSIGTVREPPPPGKLKDVREVWSVWRAP